MALTLPDVGAFTDADRNAAVTKIAAMDATFSGKIDWSAFAPVAGGSVNGSMIDFGGAWIPFTTAGAAAIKMLCDNKAATGNFATARLRARSSVATPTWNSNTIALDAESSAHIADYGELLAGSFYTNDNGYAQTRATHWATAAKFVTNCSGASVGSRYALVVSDYSSTLASGSHHALARFDKPSGAQAITSVFVFGNCDQFTYLFNFEVASGYMSSSDTRVKVKTVAGDKYIHLESS